MVPRARPRALVVILVYDGHQVVEACLESAVCQEADGVDVDVLVLDDCSPAPGWSEELAAICDRLGIAHHRNRRNVGIPRNMNLGLLAAERGGYDHAVLCNSDVVLGRRSIGHLVEVAESDPQICLLYTSDAADD